MFIELLSEPAVIGAIIGAFVGAVASAAFAIITEKRKFSKQKRAHMHLYDLKFLILLNYLKNLEITI